MSATDRTALIERWKAVNEGRRHGIRHELGWLANSYAKTETGPARVADVYPVRAVAILEVFTRGWTAIVVDHSSEFAQRAVSIMQSVKPDYGLILGIVGERFTFGDLVGSAIPVSATDHILSVFSKLLAKDIPATLRTVTGLKERKTEGEKARPIISDYDATMAAVGGLFELRHRICHEAPRYSKEDFAHLGDQLQAAAAFAAALEETVLQELYGVDRPYSQSEMNHKAHQEYLSAEAEMKRVLTSACDKVKNETRRVALLKESQELWERSARLEAEFFVFPTNEGTIAPLLFALEMKRLTEDRRRLLERYLVYVTESSLA